jgi:hypothetical protein
MRYLESRTPQLLVWFFARSIPTLCQISTRRGLQGEERRLYVDDTLMRKYEREPYDITT